MDQKKIEVYTRSWCSYCWRAKRLLKRKGYAFEEIDATDNDELRAWLARTTGRKTVPQIFIDGRAIGGSDELAALDRAGKLDALLAA